MELLVAMKKYRDAGLCPIPVAGKKPLLKAWAAVEQMPMDSDMASWANLRSADGLPMDGVGLVCGKVSGGLVCIDLDMKNDPTNTMVREWLALVEEMGGKEIINACIGQNTPSGGGHLIFRCPEVHDGNQIFAKSDVTNKAVIETRGQGGQFVAFPSPGYTLRKGPLLEVKTLPLASAELLFSAARAVDRAPLTHSEAKPPAAMRAGGEITPVNDYDSKATLETMQAEIEAVGFTAIRQRGENIHYHRPGKSGRDTSATLHVGKLRFYVFTTSTELEAGRAYSPAALMCYLHYSGDWSATAGALRKAGYGSPRPAAQGNTYNGTLTQGAATPAPGVGQPAAQAGESGIIIISAADLKVKVSEFYRRPFDPGESTGWPELDRHLRIRKRRLNVVTGIPGSGKSSFTNHLFMNLAFRAGWRVAIFSPESESPEEHAANLCEIRAGKPFFGQGRMTPAEAESAAADIARQFVFLDQDLNGVSFDDLLRAALETKPDALFLDPWNRLTHVRPDGMTETEYIGACLSRGAAFARMNNLSLWIVAHPQKVRKSTEGKQLRPGLYDISGSANWANMTDNAIMVWRDYEGGYTEIEVIKVRGKRDGEPGIIKMKFDKETGRFFPWSEVDDFSPKIPPLRSEARRGGSPETSLPDGDRD